MKIQTKASLGCKREAILCACLAGSGMLLLPGQANAQLATLTDGGSTALVNLGSSAGMYSWTVPGLSQNQLNQQWFWYSINGGTVASVDSLGTPVWNQNGGLNTLNATYTDNVNQFSVTIGYVLTATGVGSADLTESIAVDNLNPNPSSSFNFNLFEYSNFTLLQEANNQVQVFGDYDINNNLLGYNLVKQTSGTTAIQEGITSPDANFAEAGLAAPTLTDVESGNNLNDNLSAGPNDVAWSFEWTTAISGLGEFDVFKDKSLDITMVPEPSSYALVGLGLGALGFIRRRKA